MTPQQKAAQTRKTNREAKLAAERAAVAVLRAKVQRVCDAHSGRHFMEGGGGVSCFVSVVALVGDRRLSLRSVAYGHGLIVDANLDIAMKEAGIESYGIALD